MSRCDYCGAAFMRHELTRNESGFLACPDDRKGNDEVKINRLNAEHASHVKGLKHPDKYDGGADPNARTLPIIHRTTASDITRYIS
jgi:hypothetical protein